MDVTADVLTLVFAFAMTTLSIGLAWAAYGPAQREVSRSEPTHPDEDTSVLAC